MKASFLLFSLLTSIGLCSCSSHKEAPLPPQTKQAAPAPKPKPLPVQIGEAVAGVDSFAVQMFSVLAASQESNFAFSLESAYFGTDDNKVSEERLVELGRCFARAIKKYIKENEK